MKLEAGQVAVVTGAASGIGLALAGAFAARGLGVMLADVDEAGLAAAVEAIGPNAAARRTDVRDPDAVEALAAATLDRFGRYDVICNNAGVAPPPAYLWEHDLKAWDWAIDVMLKGTINGIRAFVPGLIARGTGHVVNTASVGGLAPLPVVGPYCAAKYAVVGLSECLADELRGVAPGVGVSILCPGMTESRLSVSSAKVAPAGLGAPRTSVPEALVDELMARSGDVIPAEETAAITLDGIERGLLRILTHGDLHLRTRERVLGGA